MVLLTDCNMQQPSKSMVDYMMELNRLFPKNPVTDVMSTPNTSYQPAFSHHSHFTSNYSSSSTDSYSPETFPELTFKRSEQCRGPQCQRSMTETPRLLETPFALARRPIVGRKIIDCTEKPMEHRTPEDRYYETRANTPMSPIRYWVDNTPPNMKERRYNNNAYYELFPGENKGFGFKTPVKTSSVYSNMSPSSPMSQNSPVNSNYGMLTPPQYTNPLMLGANSPMSVGVKTSNVGANSPMSIGANSPMNLGASTSGFHDGSQKMCTFCRKNGETPLVYMTHTVKEKRGTKNIVTCPILRSHVCSTCGASGDNAHTITYCPVLRSSNNGMPLKSTTITLKNTRIKSNGRRRY